MIRETACFFKLSVCKKRWLVVTGAGAVFYTGWNIKESQSCIAVFIGLNNCSAPSIIISLPEV